MSNSSVSEIRTVSREDGTPFVPPLSSYELRSETWVETEYHCFRDATGQVLCAVWEGEPGAVYLGPWPYDELCVMLSGSVALVDEDGGRRSFGAGDAFLIPRSFSGTWETIEPSRKIFVAIGAPSAPPPG